VILHGAIKYKSKFLYFSLILPFSYIILFETTIFNFLSLIFKNWIFYSILIALLIGLVLHIAIGIRTLKKQAQKEIDAEFPEELQE
jgi:succinate dehydrogenase/fumarate reductase cytochrome b subunit